MQKTLTARERYREYKTKMQKIADVRYAMAVLNWDEETYLPEKGASHRSRQLAALSGIAHEMFAEDALGDLLEQLKDEKELSPAEQKNITLTLDDYHKNKKYTTAFVTRLSETASAGYHAWIRARRENDYRIFEPLLRNMVELKRQEAEILGYEQHPYNALLNDYEKGATVAMLDKVFGEVKGGLQPLLDLIGRRPEADNAFLYRHYDREKQWQFGLEVLKAMGFDFKKGRQDISEHPFTTSFGACDVRITTRIDEQDFGNMTWSCIHEGGHALYEQGLPPEEYGLPCGEAASLSIHESQSRLWENCVGRGRDFWRHYYEKIQRLFPANLQDISPDGFYKGVNRVRPSLIRTEADELTYHLHIIIRYEIEKKLIGGDLQTAELKDLWNELYHQYLGVQVPDDRRGILQDIHWSHGSFGYFPTYSLGSLYAAQFFETACGAVPDLQEQIACGNLAPLLQWLRTEIHQYGRYYTSEELCTKVTGKGLDFQCFLQYARQKWEITDKHEALKAGNRK